MPTGVCVETGWTVTGVGNRAVKINVILAIRIRKHDVDNLGQIPFLLPHALVAALQSSWLTKYAMSYEFLAVIAIIMFCWNKLKQPRTFPPASVLAVT